jgi:hypothetical protein
MEITLAELEEALDKRFSKMATKEDLKAFATKEDLKAFATKDDLKAFATKDDLKEALAPYATKDDLREALIPYATKDDLTTLEKNLKAYAEDQTETLAAYIAETIAIPLQEHIESCQKIRI